MEDRFLRGLRAVEKSREPDVEEAKAMKVHVETGDIRTPSNLERTNIREDRTLIAVSDDDLANLEAHEKRITVVR